MYLLKVERKLVKFELKIIWINYEMNIKQILVVVKSLLFIMKLCLSGINFKFEIY